MRSPLMIGGEMTKFDEFTMSLLTNEMLIEMFSNARHSHQVIRRTIDNKETACWIASGAKGGAYVGIFNLSDIGGNVEIPLVRPTCTTTM